MRTMIIVLIASAAVQAALCDDKPLSKEAKQWRKEQLEMASISHMMTFELPPETVFDAALASAKGEKRWMVTSFSKPDLIAFDVYGWGNSGLTCTAALSPYAYRKGLTRVDVKCHSRAALLTIGDGRAAKRLFSGMVERLNLPTPGMLARVP